MIELPKFFKQFAAVFSGVAIAQVFPLLIAPVVARLYSPEVFGVFGLFMAIVTTISSVSSLRYDQAIAMSNKDTARSLTQLSLIVSAGISVIAGLGVYAFMWLAPTKFDDTAPVVWALLATFGTFVLGGAVVFQNFATSQKNFQALSISYILRSTTSAGAQLVSSAMGAFGLIAAVILGAIACVAPFMNREVMSIFRDCSIPRLRKSAHEYRDFPLFNAPQGLFNSLSQNAPVLILAALDGAAFAGAYSMAVRLLQRPVSIISEPLRQVFIREASERHEQSTRRSLHLYRRITCLLFLAAIVPTVVVVVWGEEAFAKVLGAEWRPAGGISRWIICWVAAMFVSMPATVMSRILRIQKQMLGFQLTAFVIRTTAMYAGCTWLSAESGVALFCVAGIVLNLALVAWIDRILATDKNKVQFGSDAVRT